MDSLKKYDDVFNRDNAGEYKLNRKDLLFIELIKKEQ